MLGARGGEVGRVSVLINLRLICRIGGGRKEGLSFKKVSACSWLCAVQVYGGYAEANVLFMHRSLTTRSQEPFQKKKKNWTTTSVRKGSILASLQLGYPIYSTPTTTMPCMPPSQKPNRVCWIYRIGEKERDDMQCQCMHIPPIPSSHLARSHIRQIYLHNTKLKQHAVVGHRTYGLSICIMYVNVRQWRSLRCAACCCWNNPGIYFPDHRDSLGCLPIPISMMIIQSVSFGRRQLQCENTTEKQGIQSF